MIRENQVAEAGLSPLEELLQEQSLEIDQHSQRLGLNPETRNLLIAAGVGFGALTAIFGPTVASAINDGMTFSEAVVYSVGSQGLAGTWDAIEKSTAVETVKAFSQHQFSRIPDIWQDEISKYATEWRAFTSTLVGIGLLGGYIEGRLKIDKARDGLTTIRRKGEQMFFLGGTSSRIAEASTLDNPWGVIPIFESAEGGNKLVSKLIPEPRGLEKISRPFNIRPIFINLEASGNVNYRGLEAWNRIKIDPENLIKTPSGKRILTVVGCGETAEEELQQVVTIPDLTLDELHTGTEMLLNQVNGEKININIETVKIYLGSADSPHIDPEGGSEVILDKQFALDRGVDIYIDTWRSYLWGIKKELEQKNLAGRGIRLITSIPEYRKLFEQVAKEIGLKLYTKDDDFGNAVLVTYERLSDETLNSVKYLSQIYPDRNIMALTSDIDTHNAALVDYADNKKIRSICSAVIVKNLLNAVRELLRKGEEPKKIQQMIDNLFMVEKEANILPNR